MSNTPTSSAQVAEGLNLLPCVHCGAKLEPFGPDQANHPRNECWLSSVRVLRSEAESWNRRTAAPVAEGVALPPLDAEGLLPLPEMLEATDLAYVLETPADWDADYRATWQKLQVSDCNRRQWRTYALQLRAALIAYIDGRTAGPAVPEELRKTVNAHCNDLLDCAAIPHDDGRFTATAAEIRLAVAELKSVLAAAPSPLPPKEKDK